MTVMVKCKSCGNEFRSLFQTKDEEALKNNTITNMGESCPSCHQMSNYNSPDYYWK